MCSFGEVWNSQRVRNGLGLEVASINLLTPQREIYESHGVLDWQSIDFVMNVSTSQSNAESVCAFPVDQAVAIGASAETSSSLIWAIFLKTN